MSEASEKRTGMTPWLRYETGEAFPSREKIISVEIARFAAAPG